MSKSSDLTEAWTERRYRLEAWKEGGYRPEAWIERGYGPKAGGEGEWFEGWPGPETGG